MNKTAVQIVFNGVGNTVVGTIEQALAEVELNLAGEPLPPFEAEYPSLHAAGIDIPLAYRLARMARDQHREEVSLILHDLDSRPGYATAYWDIDLVHPDDPGCLLALALMKAEDTDKDLEDIANELEHSVRQVSVGITPARQPILLGGPWPFMLKKGADETTDGVAARAREKFLELADKAFPDEAPSMGRTI